MHTNLQIIIDFDGTLTAEETQVAELAARSLDTLAGDILGVPRPVLARRYQETRERLLEAPHRYFWEVNGLVASYCDEGAFTRDEGAGQSSAPAFVGGICSSRSSSASSCCATGIPSHVDILSRLP